MRVTGILALALVFLGSGAGQATADVSFYAVFKDIVYTQTSNAQPASPSSFFVNGEVDSNISNDLTSGSITNNSSGTSFTTSISSPGGLFFPGSFYSSLADMNAAFPDGSTDAFSVMSSSLGTLNDTLTQPAASLFTSNIPYLTNFSQLQGMDPSQPLTVDFPGTQQVAGANASGIFFTIFGTNVSAGLPDSATSSVIPANALQPNTTYTFELDYSNRLSTTATGGFNGANGNAAYDVRTDGTFTTGSATPEPTSAALFGMALAGLGVARWRKRKQAA